MTQKLLDMCTNMNTAFKNEHDPKFERQNWVLKESFHDYCHTLPFKLMTQMMLINMFNNSTLLINILTTKCGVHITVITHELITGIQIDYNCHWKISSVYTYITMIKRIQQIIFMQGQLELSRSIHPKILRDIISNLSRKRYTSSTNTSGLHYLWPRKS